MAKKNKPLIFSGFAVVWVCAGFDLWWLLGQDSPGIGDPGWVFYYIVSFCALIGVGVGGVMTAAGGFRGIQHWNDD